MSEYRITDKLPEYTFQGYQYLLEKQPVNVSTHFSFCEAVDTKLFSTALNKTLDRIPYFKTHFCLDGDELCLAVNDSPCILYCGKEKRKIPEETNGYLFYIFCDGNTVYCEWNHFISDTRGFFAFLSQIIGEYCTLRYNEPFIGTDFPYEPGLTWDEITPYYQKQNRQFNILDANETELLTNETHEIVLHLDKESVVNIAKKMDIKPFSLLLAVFSVIIKVCGKTESISIGYPIDFRKNISHPNAFFNCVTMYRREINDLKKFSFKGLATEIDQGVRDSLVHENTMLSAARDFGMIQEIMNIKADMKMKKRIYEMSKSINFMDLFSVTLVIFLFPTLSIFVNR